MTAARFLAKVYSPTGATLRRVLGAKLILSVPTITREIGKPAGDLTIDLALPWDDFGYGDTINLFDLVKIYAVNADNPTGLLVFQGHIEEINGYFSSGRNGVALRIFPIDALLGRSLWKSGTYAVAFAGVDVSAVLDAAVDDINTIYGATFLTKNLGNAGQSITQTYTRQSHLAAIQSAEKFLPDGWYWRITEAGRVDLAQWNDSAADHKLVVERHVDSVQVIKSVMDTKNKLVVSWNSPIEDDEYQDATSVAAYGRRMKLYSESGLGNQASADAKGQGELDRQSGIFTKTVVVVNSTYPIETIRPGDTCSILNVSDGTQGYLSEVNAPIYLLDENGLPILQENGNPILIDQGGTLAHRIVRVEYDGRTATLHLEDVADNFGTEFTKATS